MNKLAKIVVLGLVATAVVTSVVSSLAVWHQPATPSCIA